MSNWYRVKITVSNEAVEPMSGGLFEFSASGVQIESTNHARGSAVLIVYLPDETSIEDIRLSMMGLIDRVSASGFDTTDARLDIEPVGDENWIENYKRFFSPLKIGRVMIKPSWEDVASHPDEIVVQLDPGLAFGTGSHPTTEGCVLRCRT
ncbi:MAG: 50S ribosomal protein L11 methyltransferase [Rubrobacteridae bacterium]|nr:50S ribosomal protein L11 methyltransferase [Rubrobacteridae bacterium]